MSILKQMEESKLTPEEIRELLSVLTTVLPKIEQRVVQNETTNKLTRNLNRQMAESGGGMVQVPQKDDNSLSNGLNLLKSAKIKLEHFITAIGEING